MRTIPFKGWFFLIQHCQLSLARNKTNGGFAGILILLTLEAFNASFEE